MPEPGTAPVMEKRRPKAHTIWIEVQDGRLTYLDQDSQPAHSKHAHHEDRIGWESRTGEEFTITFNPLFSDPQVFHSAGGKVLPQKPSAHANENHSYKYTVHMLASNLQDDPDIIIDPCND